MASETLIYTSHFPISLPTPLPSSFLPHHLMKSRVRHFFFCLEPTEAVAADKAGMQVNVVVREGNVPLTDDEKKAFTVVSNFNDIVFESSNKKKKLCETGQETEKVENVS